MRGAVVHSQNAHQEAHHQGEEGQRQLFSEDSGGGVRCRGQHYAVACRVAEAARAASCRLAAQKEREKRAQKKKEGEKQSPATPSADVSLLVVTFSHRCLSRRASRATCRWWTWRSSLPATMSSAAATVSSVLSHVVFWRLTLVGQARERATFSRRCSLCCRTSTGH